ncbi:MAG TPA: tRNA (N(6)-L-threonylcarbamoyladenosine(37)-C(2))-methylthiotransferase MtaB, partial [Hanamia sp.]
RADTYALNITPVVPLNIRHQRTKLLRSLSYKKMQEFSQKHSGETRKVLFEGKNKTGIMEGFSDNYIKISTPYREDWTNQIIDWKI